MAGKYMETFVREAIARAAFERAEVEAGQGGGRGGGGGGWQGGFLEVSGLVWNWGLEKRWERGGEGRGKGRGQGGSGEREWGCRLICWCDRLKIWRNWHRSFCWIFELWARSRRNCTASGRGV